MYNEEAGASECVRRVTETLLRLDRRTVLIVVDDGSRDRTGAILQELAQTRPELVVVRHESNMGYGAALQTGAREASARRFTHVLYMDSDLTNDPVDIPRFLDHVDRGVDVIKATRYSGGGRPVGVPMYRVAISAAGNQIARRLFRLPLHDCTNGFRAVRSELLVQMRLRERGFAVIVEELWWCRFLARTFAEVPVALTNRSPQHRRSSFTYTPRTFWRYFRYPLLSFLGIAPFAREERPSP